MKIFLWVAVIVCLLLGGAGIYFMTSNQSTNVSVDAPTEGYEYVDTPRYALSDFSWVVGDLPSTDGVPKNSVALSVKGKLYPAGESVGCNTEAQSELKPSEVARLVCWFAGGGDEFVVTNEEGVYRLIRRWVQESGGPEVQAETQGPWEVIEILG
jgi:hypothetical protein